MASVDTQWAIKSILQLGHHHLRHGAETTSSSSSCLVRPTSPPFRSASKAVQVTAMPRLMRASCDPSYVILLAKRPSGIAGVSLRPGNRVPWTGLPAAASSLVSAPCSKKTRLLASYLQRRGFATIRPVATDTHSSPSQFRPVQRSMPLLLHTSHLIGWKLNDASPAFPVYAHTLAELQQLRSSDVAALKPQHCLIANEYCEWDNWREVLGEPGWDLFSADEDAVERLLQDGLAISALEEEAGLYPVEVL
ncbi:conserved hypothetical protein [Leishmania major strain Friedlin]|uniref:Uncharacterized protein n=1 Tax=Leishmania major TaxID=5664 RepID=Q4Q1A5_LEIMA|nr:conserved hypothetical protein [Leishmania major strain Friedlin]CAG9583850.1 hypothetical_protein_-_conserved [Leishmania major strain Friedlin]CAJ09276.1 conserved hypothetical protein [Leishmania major strain Friedlin]|eukprot:XP_001686893.1 conserved hypothetical protein [Leishmania major strain Friedlin]